MINAKRDGKDNMLSYLKNEEGKNRLIFNDFVIKKNYCNLRCKYCLSNEAPDWTNADKVELLEYSEKGDLKERLNKVHRKYEQNFDATILRISGGELFLIKNIEEFIVACSKSYDDVQIITNGCNVTKEKLQVLRQVDNCCIHFSLDGHTAELNRYRTDNMDKINAILNNIDLAVNLGFYVEIGSVLTDTNTQKYIETVEYFRKKYTDKVKLYPFPIRGEIAKKMGASDSAVNAFGYLLEKYEQFKDVLAPKAYIQDVYENLSTKKRTQRCLIPLVSMQLFDDGNLSACPNSWGENSANLLEDDNVLDKVDNAKMYKLFLQDKPRLKCCFDCYTSMDIVNIYINGRMTDEELLSIPLYRGKRTFELLSEVRNKVLNHE